MLRVRRLTHADVAVLSTSKSLILDRSIFPLVSRALVWYTVITKYNWEDSA